jgi:hypothetical protein
MTHRNSDDTPPVAALVLAVRPVIVTLFVTTAVLLVLHVVTRVVYWAGLGTPIPIALLFERFNADAETSVPTWFSILLLMSLAVAAFVIARTTRNGAGTAHRWWYAMSAVFLYLSIDEGSAFHEIAFQPMQRLLGVTSGPLLFGWVVPAGLAVIVVGAIFLRFMLRLPTPTRVGLFIGGAVYLAGALGMEMVAGSLVQVLADSSGMSLSFDLLAGVEETLEMIGSILVLRALLVHLRDFVLPSRTLVVNVD